MTVVTANPSKADTRILHEWAAGYALTHRSIALARSNTRRRLTRWRWGGDIEDAVLVVSELTTNAVDHAHAPGRQMRLRLALLDDGVLLTEVSDPIAAFPGFDTAIRPADGDEQGRGLLVVRSLSDEVAWHPRQHGGKTVRARVLA